MRDVAFPFMYINTYLPTKDRMKFKNFKHKAISRTVDAYPGLTPEQRFALSIAENYKNKDYSEATMKEVLKNVKFVEQI